MKYKLNLSPALFRKYGFAIVPQLETIMRRVKPLFDGPIANKSEVTAETTAELRDSLLATRKATASEVDEALAAPLLVTNRCIYTNSKLTDGIRVTISAQDKNLSLNSQEEKS